MALETQEAEQVEKGSSDEVLHIYFFAWMLGVLLYNRVGATRLSLH